jgi:hypothetical protein
MMLEYRTKRLLPLDEILTLLDKVKAGATNFVGFSPQTSQFGGAKFKRQLPTLDQLQGVELTSMHMVGHLPVSDKSYTSLKELFCQHAGTAIGCEALFSIHVHFEEAGSQQKRSNADTFAAHFRYGHAHFLYRAGGGSQVARDHGYAARFFSELAQTADLPVRVDQRGGDYFLEHGGQRELWTSYKGTKGENAKAIRCELPPETTAEQLCERMDRALATHASEKRLGYSWSITVDDQGSEATERLYAAAVTAQLPAARHELTCSLRLKEIAGVEGLKELCQGKGEVLTQVATFDFGEEDEYGELYIVTSAAGHRLELRLSLEDHLETVQDLAGVKFVGI